MNTIRLNSQKRTDNCISLQCECEIWSRKPGSIQLIPITSISNIHFSTPVSICTPSWTNRTNQTERSQQAQLQTPKANYFHMLPGHLFSMGDSPPPRNQHNTLHWAHIHRKHSSTNQQHEKQHWLSDGLCLLHFLQIWNKAWIWIWILETENWNVTLAIK